MLIFEKDKNDNKGRYLQEIRMKTKKELFTRNKFEKILKNNELRGKESI